MKTKHFHRSLALFAVMSMFVGCDKASSPVIPYGNAVLKLSIPPFVLNSKPSPAALKKLGAKNTLPDTSSGTLKYYLTTDGQAPIKGSIDYQSGSEVGTITIPLPKAGKWIAAVEWFYTGDGTIPEFAGAEEVSVQGETSLTVNMEDIRLQESGCYTPYLADTACSYGYYDLYDFDSGLSQSSTIFSQTGDIQVANDVNTGFEYLQYGATIVSGPASIFAYLGNGDFIDFPTIADNATYYTTSLEAKAAVVGASNEAMAQFDIFVIKVPSTGAKVWTQIYYPPYTCGTFGQYLALQFIYNAAGVNFMKFDETTNGHNNCNQNVSVP